MKFPYKLRPPGTLKEAATVLVAACGGQDRAADIAGTSRQSIFRYTDSDNHADRHMPVHVVRALERVADEPLVTRFLAAEAGYTLLRLPRAVAGDWGREIGRLSGETSDVIAALACALDNDGRIDAAEAGEGISQIDDVFAVLTAMRDRLVPIRDSGE